jgi:hypothetical protein
MQQLRFKLPEEERDIERIMRERCCSREQAKKILAKPKTAAPRPPQPEPHWKLEEDA